MSKNLEIHIRKSPFKVNDWRPGKLTTSKSTEKLTPKIEFSELPWIKPNVPKKRKFMPAIKKVNKTHVSLLSRFRASSEKTLKTYQSHQSCRKKLDIQVATPVEIKEIESNIKKTLEKELKKSQCKFLEKVEKMNKIGVIPQEINEIRAKSLLSVKANLM